MLTTFSQGTRSIIDNLDTGTSVVPILTRYEGVADCFSSLVWLPFPLGRPMLCAAAAAMTMVVTGGTDSMT